MLRRAENLRRRLATYRRRLAEDTDIESVRMYLAAIVADQRELDGIEAILGQAKKTDTGD